MCTCYARPRVHTFPGWPSCAPFLGVRVSLSAASLLPAGWRAASFGSTPRLRDGQLHAKRSTWRALSLVYTEGPLRVAGMHRSRMLACTHVCCSTRWCLPAAYLVGTVCPPLSYAQARARAHTHTCMYLRVRMPPFLPRSVRMSVCVCVRAVDTQGMVRMPAEQRFDTVWMRTVC